MRLIWSLHSDDTSSFFSEPRWGRSSIRDLSFRERLELIKSQNSHQMKAYNILLHKPTTNPYVWMPLSRFSIGLHKKELLDWKERTRTQWGSNKKNINITSGRKTIQNINNNNKTFEISYSSEWTIFLVVFVTCMLNAYTLFKLKLFSVERANRCFRKTIFFYRTQPIYTVAHWVHKFCLKWESTVSTASKIRNVPTFYM